MPSKDSDCTTTYKFKSAKKMLIMINEYAIIINSSVLIFFKLALEKFEEKKIYKPSQCGFT